MNPNELVVEMIDHIKAMSDELYSVKSDILEKTALIEVLETRYRDLKRIDGWKDDIIKAKDRLKKEREELIKLKQSELRLTNEVEKSRLEYSAISAHRLEV